MSLPHATAENPRAVMGANEAPDYARRVTEQMRADYAALSEAVAKLLLEASVAVPETIEDDEQLKLVATTVVNMRDAMNRALAFHKREKEPHLRGGEAVDSFFFDFRDRLTRAMKEIGGRGDAYNQRKLAAERAARERAAREAAEQAEARRKVAERIEREAEEARAAAERARKPERVAELDAKATEKEREADLTHVASQMAHADAGAAFEQTQQTSAEIARKRFDTGRMTTMKQVGHVEITDAAALPLDRLRPYLPEEALLKAVKAFAKVTNYKTPLPGAVIEMRDATVYR